VSNYLAVATVTATLEHVLTQAVGQDVPGVQVKTTPPDAAAAGGGGARINLFLYQVTPSAAARNDDLPTRSSDGQTVLNRPRIGLDLHYLLTFYGDEAAFLPQLLLGSAVKTLHSRPVLTRPQIQDALTAFPELQSSNLADDIELVKFTQLPLTLEELSKLWSVFYLTTYQLSVAYQGTVVLIEGDDTANRPLPVLSRNVYAYPFDDPRIESIAAAAGSDKPIVAGSQISIRGQRLQGASGTTITLDGDPLPTDSVAAQEILATLPAALIAGVHSIQVKHTLQMGTPLADHPGTESNVMPFVLTPQIKPAAGGPPPWDITQLPPADPNFPGLAVGVDPPVTDRQRVFLLLNEIVTKQSYTLQAAPRTGGVPVDKPEFHWEPMVVGSYLARIQVDGADSPLVLPDDPTVNPKVTIP
jgi:hypothetical protein